jgi:curved DNA-binding protein CbpA
LVPRCPKIFACRLSNEGQASAYSLSIMGVKQLVLFAVVACVAFARDQYEVLGVSGSADTKAIRKAYRDLSGQFHPDKHTDSSEDEQKAAALSMEELTLAFRTLSDPENRKRYDSDGKLADDSGDVKTPRAAGEQSGVDDSAGSWFVLLCGALCFAVPVFMASGKKKSKKGTPKGLKKGGNTAPSTPDHPAVAYAKDLTVPQMVCVALIAFLLFQTITAPTPVKRGAEKSSTDDRTDYQKSVDTCLQSHGRKKFTASMKCLNALADDEKNVKGEGKNDPIVLAYLGDALLQKGDSEGALSTCGRAFRKLESGCKGDGSKCAKGDSEKRVPDLFDVKMMIMRNQAQAHLNNGNSEAAVTVSKKALADTSNGNDSDHVHFIRETLGQVVGELQAAKRKADGWVPSEEGATRQEREVPSEEGAEGGADGEPVEDLDDAVEGEEDDAAEGDL